MASNSFRTDPSPARAAHRLRSWAKSLPGFTLIELLVVIAIIAILAAILFPVFAQVKATAKKAVCLSNMKQVGTAVEMYMQDYDSTYPQTKGKTTPQPQIDDLDGSIEEPDIGSLFTMILPYAGGGRKLTDEAMLNHKLYACPTDPNPFDPKCPTEVNPGGPNVNSYLVNGYFVWGLQEAGVNHVTSTIYLAERRSVATDTSPQYCDDIYHPWWNETTFPSVAPANDMDPHDGAIAALRHNEGANYVFADTHAGWRMLSQTYAPGGVNLHDPFAP